MSEIHRSIGVNRSIGASSPQSVGGGRGRLPLGVQTFRKVRESGGYYVDKTAYAYRMISEGECYFLSRPRRFGKSLFVDTLKELFEGNDELFEGLFVHGRWDWSVRRPVVRIDFSGGHFTEAGGLRQELLAQLEDIESRAGLTGGTDALPARLRRLLEGLHRRSGRRVAVLVDEYDKPILDALGAPGMARANRDFLGGFYGVLKAADAHLRFVLLTGVSKFSKVSLFSGLNNLRDITLNPVYSSVCGFTEGDLDRVFAAELEGLDRERVREWYNGYSWLGPEKVYNPYDVLMLLAERRFEAYWFETGSPGFLLDTLMDRGVSTVTLGDTVSTAELLSAFDVDRIATEALLFQTGYLTIAGTEEWDDETYYKLAYPNLEVRKSLHGALLDRMADDTGLRTASVRRLRQALRDGDGDGLCSLFGSFLAGIPYQWHARGGAARYESYYASVFYSCFAALGLDIAVEDATSRGRIDMAVRTPQRIWLFEFKITGTSGADRSVQAGVGMHAGGGVQAGVGMHAGAGMQQMLDRGYADKYRAHGLPIHLVAIEFDPETRSITHSETHTA